jgi:hypothetical protein
MVGHGLIRCAMRWQVGQSSARSLMDVFVSPDVCSGKIW